MSDSSGPLGGIYHVSAMYVNPVNSSLLVGTRYLGMFEHRETMDHTGKASLTTHDGICNQALYNPLFDVVSCKHFYRFITAYMYLFVFTWMNGDCCLVDW